MPIFDLICNECFIVAEDQMIRSGESPSLECPDCGKLMVKKPDFGSFELKYNNKTDMCDWNGETSQYWRAYKEAKGRGENVKPADAD